MAENENGSVPTMGKPKTSDDWHRDLLERLAFASLNEQRRSRRWTIFFRLLFLFAIFFLPLIVLIGALSERPFTGRYTALVDMDGIIAPDSLASADNVISGLRAAFESKATVGVILRSNSPGGSPVQAAYINDEIKRLRELYPSTPVYAVISDVCASGCYYAVAGADKIYANKSSIVGSIGVLMNGFGFVNSLKKLGIERRLFTAGKYKGFLDPFSPLNSTEKRYAQKLLDKIHQQFIDVVKSGRGEALSKNNIIYSGLFWTGEQAIELGLVDELGSAGHVAREVIGAEEIVDFTYRENPLDRFARRIGSAMADTIGYEVFYSSLALR